jgi:hypothetical protein
MKWPAITVGELKSTLSGPLGVTSVRPRTAACPYSGSHAPGALINRYSAHRLVPARDE